MTAKSPSPSNRPLEGRMVAEKLLKIVSVDPSNSVIDVGLKVPVKSASVGCGLVPPIPIGEPLNESPSSASVKYETGSVTVEPSEKCTVRLRLENVNAVLIGNDGSPEEFAPVPLKMSNSAELPGVVTS